MMGSFRGLGGRLNGVPLSIIIVLFLKMIFREITSKMMKKSKADNSYRKLLAAIDGGPSKAKLTRSSCM